MNVAPIPAGEILLHVGVHKTGTTALQTALAAARPALAGHGVRYPGEDTFQHAAILARTHRDRGWRDDDSTKRPMRYWRYLVREAKFSGRTIISSEFLDDVPTEVAAEVIDDLGGKGRVRIAITLRPIGAILPSGWQQRLKAGKSQPFERWLNRMLDDPDSSAAAKFWFRHDQQVQVARWARIVGADRTHVIVLPQADRSFMFRAFAGLLGLPRDLLIPQEAPRGNRSMTAAEAELIRQVNAELTTAMGWPDYSRLVRSGVILALVEGREPGPDEAAIRCPDWAADRAAQLGAGYEEAIREMGVDVVGELGELATRVPSDVPAMPEFIRMEAAALAVTGAVRAALQSQ